MQNTTTTAAVSKKQNVIAVSESAKAFVAKIAGEFSAPSKSKEDLQASEREVFDAMVDFVEAFRFSKVQKTEVIDGEEIECFDENGEPELENQDEFAFVMQDVLALRMTTSRTNSASKLLADKDKELAELREMLAKLQGTQA